MNWEQWFCTNQACTAETWMVCCDARIRETWWVAAHVDDHPFTEAATEPFCPRCGMTLGLPAERARQVDDNMLAINLMRVFVRDLPQR